MKIPRHCHPIPHGHTATHFLSLGRFPVSGMARAIRCLTDRAARAAPLQAYAVSNSELPCHGHPAGMRGKKSKNTMASGGCNFPRRDTPVIGRGSRQVAGMPFSAARFLEVSENTPV